MTVRVRVADDQALVRAGFRLLVDSAPDLEVGPRPGGGFRVAARLPLGVEGR